MTRLFLEALVRGLAPALKEYVARELAPLLARIVELEATHLKYEGTWKPEQVYGLGAGVTHHGSLWIARRATAQPPGDPDSGWQLAAKRGRDARDR